ncbi:MAG TPA: hypothetical protein VEG30_03315 [Terriglobales bacterium]|nr:hypothetical protein [Terriglobales bacterium]
MRDPKLTPHSDSDEESLGTVHERLEGWIPQMASDEEIRLALEKAFDYRGDITITLKNGESIEGYIFDRRSHSSSLNECTVRFMPRNQSGKITLRYSDIAGLAFTGRDTAAGKSFEAWVKKYKEKKAAGEKNIGIDSEPLD